jgi:hypothetical protein
MVKHLVLSLFMGETTEPLVFYIGDGVNKREPLKFWFQERDILGTLQNQ